MHKLLGLALVAVLAASCDTPMAFRGNPDDAGVPKDSFVEGGAPLTGVDLDALWDRAQQVIAMEGLGIDDGKTRFADRLIVSRWSTHLTISRFEGYRTRTWVRLRQGKAGEWTAGVSVQRQKNMDIKQPSEELAAQWEDAPPENGRAAKILWKIESGFRVQGADAAPR